jgi:hypothetical protein
MSWKLQGTPVEGAIKATSAEKKDLPEGPGQAHTLGTSAQPVSQEQIQQKREELTGEKK